MKKLSLLAILGLSFGALALTSCQKPQSGGDGAGAGAVAGGLSKEEFAKAKYIYFDRCSGCHGALRKGATGPNITHTAMLKREGGLQGLEEVLYEGTDGGMPGWGKTGDMTKAETQLMAKFIQVPAPIPPEVGMKEMRKSHKIHVSVGDRPKKAEHGLNVDDFFGVILRDVGQGAIIDGATKKMLNVEKIGHATHIFRASATGRYFYTVGRDGKATAIDLFMKKPSKVAEVRVCLDARSIEVSKFKGYEDKYAVVGCYWPPQIVIMDGKTLEPIKIISSRSHTYDTNDYHPEPRVATIVASHFTPDWVIAIKETGLVWFVDYTDLKNLNITQVETERFLHDGGFDATKRYLLLAANMRDHMVVVDTKTKKYVTKLETGVKPHPGRGANWNDPVHGPVSATTHLGEGKVTVYTSSPEKQGSKAWKIVHEGITEGPGLFVKTHPNSPHVWADNTITKGDTSNKKVCVFKKASFDKGANCFKASDYGKVVHFEYSRDGSEVWVSVWDKKGKLIIYDDKTLKVKTEITGDWLNTPTGKWNVYNTKKDIY